MVPKLGGRAKDGRGRSFKGLFRYVLGDKDDTRRSRRVAWALAINCAFGGDVRRAWFEMLLIWEARAALKQAAGIPLTGRDNERPALHLTLSWAPHERPDRREMVLAAMEVLDRLGLAEHQAIVACHTDEPQPHIHIVINTVHPLTGKTANLYQSKRTLSAWALNWEERHGGVQIKNRVLNRLYPAAASTHTPSCKAEFNELATAQTPAVEAPLAIDTPTPLPSGQPRPINDNRPCAASEAPLLPRSGRIVHRGGAPPPQKRFLGQSLVERFRRVARVLVVQASVIIAFAAMAAHRPAPSVAAPPAIETPVLHARAKPVRQAWPALRLS